MVTIIDVAKRAGVSASTVSYVLSGSRPIGDEVRQRVRDAVRELGYEPNSSARALRTSRTNVLALLGFVSAGHTESRVTGALMIALSDAVRRRGFDLLLVPANEGTSGIERLARTSTADAVILMGILMSDPRVDALHRLRLPAALIGHPEHDPGLSWVDLDFASAGRMGVELLAERGHEEFVFVGPPARVYRDGAGYAVRGLQGARGATRGGFVRMVKALKVQDILKVGPALDAVFTKHPNVSAVVLQYEEALPEVLRWLRASGRRVPEDVLVVAVGAWTHNATESQVTYVSSTIDRLASTVVDLAIDAIPDRPPRSVLLAPEVWDSRR